jgi:hypothetical protein
LELVLFMKPSSELDERRTFAFTMNQREDGDLYSGFTESLRGNSAGNALVYNGKPGGRESRSQLFIELAAENVGGPSTKGPDFNRPLPPQSPGLAWERDVAAIWAQARRVAQPATDFSLRMARAIDAGWHRPFRRPAAKTKASHLQPAANGRDNGGTDRDFILQIIQPGLVGLMDGSVSTLALVFAAAFATHNSWNAFLVGMAASLGAGISMGFAEALADDGKLSGRGKPYLRGLVCGLMTIAGGIGHTLPYLIPDFVTATVVAAFVVVLELLTIAWIQWRFMDAPPVSAAAKVMLGGGLVLATGILIGSS